ncbi:hypothetical protein BC828DRAFT_388666 [Blastocladiella britannica]|nr:hypothetical protein BC828DRAFT_388666 [Blastocladiella britannica]
MLSTSARSDSLDFNRTNNSEEADQNPGTQVYIRGLSFRTTEDELRDIFMPYGELDEVSLVKDPHMGECRGFAFVRYKQPEDAQKAIEGENGKRFHGRDLIVELSRRTKPRPKTPGEYLGRRSAREAENLERIRRPRGDDRGYNGRDHDRRDYDRRDREYSNRSYGGSDRDRGGRDSRDGGRGGDRGGYDDRRERRRSVSRDRRY